MFGTKEEVTCSNNKEQPLSHVSAMLFSLNACWCLSFRSCEVSILPHAKIYIAITPVICPFFFFTRDREQLPLIIKACVKILFKFSPASFPALGDLIVFYLYNNPKIPFLVSLGYSQANLLLNNLKSSLLYFYLKVP